MMKKEITREERIHFTMLAITMRQGDSVTTVYLAYKEEQHLFIFLFSYLYLFTNLYTFWLPFSMVQDGPMGISNTSLCIAHSLNTQWISMPLRHI